MDHVTARRLSVHHRAAARRTSACQHNTRRESEVRWSHGDTVPAIDRGARYVVAVTDGVAMAWLQVEAVLWLLGSIAWLVGLAQQWRLRRRFREKTGKDMYG